MREHGPGRALPVRGLRLHQQRSRLLRGQTLRTPPGFPIVEPCFAWCEGEVVATVTFVEGGTHFRTKKLLV